MPFQIIRNDITKVKADAIVNTANPNVAIGGGVDSAIYTAAGRDKLFEARKEIGILEAGEVAITDAFNLDAKYIVHVSGPWWNGGDKNEADILRKCYDKALKISYDNKCKSIAFPLLATGTYGFPKELGIQIAVDAFTAFLKDYDMEITLVVFGNDETAISGSIVDNVREFVDDNYVDNALDEEYSAYEPVRSVRGFASSGGVFGSARESTIEEPEMSDFATADTSEPLEVLEDDEPIESLDDALREIYTDSFAKHLQQLINKKGLKNSEVYAIANISKQYFSKLLKGKVKPSKEKVLSLCIGLRLNMDEAIDFLAIAGYAMSPISQIDTVVKYFITHKDYNVIKINIVLFDYGLDPLSE